MPWAGWLFSLSIWILRYLWGRSELQSKKLNWTEKSIETWFSSYDQIKELSVYCRMLWNWSKWSILFWSHLSKQKSKQILFRRWVSKLISKLFKIFEIDRKFSKFRSFLKFWLLILMVFQNFGVEFRQNLYWISKNRSRNFENEQNFKNDENFKNSSLILFDRFQNFRNEFRFNFISNFVSFRKPIETNTWSKFGNTLVYCPRYTGQNDWLMDIRTRSYKQNLA